MLTDPIDHSFKWHHLTANFMIKSHSFINLCASEDILISPLEGFISLQDQALLWRSGKTQKQIDDKIAQLRVNGGDYLADIIHYGDPITGFWKTDEVPGFSWANWGKSLKFSATIDGKKLTATAHDSIIKYAEEVKLIYYVDDDFKQTLQFPINSVEKTYDVTFVNNYFKKKLENSEVIKMAGLVNKAILSGGIQCHQ